MDEKLNALVAVIREAAREINNRSVGQLWTPAELEALARL